MKNANSGRRAWRGATTVLASVLALSICAQPIVNGFRTDIDKFLGTKSTKLVTESTDGVDLYTYKSDYSSTTELLQAIQDLGERMNEEGTVLLKNNGALPLSADEMSKVSLLGFSSYFPVQGGDMGSSLAVNEGTDADTIDFVGALAAKGYTINPTLQQMYTSATMQESFKSEIQSWGGTQTYYRIVAPPTTGYFTSKEPSQAAMNAADSGWKHSMNDYNVMIVTIARAAGENRSYMPGKAGVDPSQNLNQPDPLGLSDDERALIDAAVEAKKANGGKVITNVNITLAWQLGNVEPLCDVLLAGFDTYHSATLDVIFGCFAPTGKLPLTLPRGDAVLAVNADGVCISPNDVPGYDKDRYMPDSLKDENGKAYAYRDAAGNYYEYGFGLEG